MEDRDKMPLNPWTLVAGCKARHFQLGQDPYDTDNMGAANRFRPNWKGQREADGITSDAVA